MTNVMYGIDLPPFQGLSLGAPRYPGRRVALPWAEFFCPFGQGFGWDKNEPDFGQILWLSFLAS